MKNPSPHAYSQDLDLGIFEDTSLPSTTPTSLPEPFTLHPEPFIRKEKKEDRQREEIGKRERETALRRFRGRQLVEQDWGPSGVVKVVQGLFGRFECF